MRYIQSILLTGLVLLSLSPKSLGVPPALRGRSELLEHTWGQLKLGQRWRVTFWGETPLYTDVVIVTLNRPYRLAVEHIEPPVNQPSISVTGPYSGCPHSKIYYTIAAVEEHSSDPVTFVSLSEHALDDHTLRKLIYGLAHFPGTYYREMVQGQVLPKHVMILGCDEDPSEEARFLVAEFQTSHPPVEPQIWISSHYFHSSKHVQGKNLQLMSQAVMGGRMQYSLLQEVVSALMCTELPQPSNNHPQIEPGTVTHIPLFWY